MDCTTSSKTNGSWNLDFHVFHADDPSYMRAYGLVNEVVGVESVGSGTSPVAFQVSDQCSGEASEDGGTCVIDVALCEYPLGTYCDSVDEAFLTENEVSSAVLVLKISSSDVALFSTGSSIITVELSSSLVSDSVTVVFQDNYDVDGNEDIQIESTYAVVYYDSGDSISLSSSNLDGLPATITKIDDDSAGLDLSTSKCSKPQTSEDGMSCEVQLRLSSKPESSVSVDVEVLDTLYAYYSENETVAFTTTTWNKYQTVTIIGKDCDTVKNDPVSSYGIMFVASSSDSSYDLTSTLNFTHGDNDYVAILDVTDLTGDYTDEFGLEQTFDLGLDFQPSADIYFPINSSDNSEGMVSVDGVYFICDTSNLTTLLNSQFIDICQDGEYLDCSGNCVTGTASSWTCTDVVTASGVSFVSWDTTVSVTVMSKDDADVDGTQYYTITIGPGKSTADAYSGITEYLTFTSYDNDNLISLHSTKCTLVEKSGECDVGARVRMQDPRIASALFYFKDEPALQVTPSSSYLTQTSDVNVTISAVNNFIDNGDQNIKLAVGLNVTFSSGSEPATVSLTQALNLSVSVLIIDDETAGLQIAQGGETWRQLKAIRDDSDESFDDYPILSSLRLPTNTTYESSKNETVEFKIRLTSIPTSPVYVKIFSEAINPNGGDIRFEGIPSLSSGGTNSYSYVSESIYINGDHVANIDTVQNFDGYAQLVYAEANYSDYQTIAVIGLDDAVDDYTVPYNITIQLTSTDSNYDGLALTLPLQNTDNEKASWVVYVEDGEDECSEPYYSKTGYINFYLTVEPKSTVLFYLSSSDTVEAGPDTTFVAIDKYTWDSVQTISISSNDDSIADGDIAFNISIAVVLTGDPDFGSNDVNQDGQKGLLSRVTETTFVSLDDPDDAYDNACQKGEYGMYPSCSSCPKGSYADEAGDKDSCRLCPPGTYGIVVGAQAMGISTDTDGSLLAPGCLPCADGEASAAWGATACAACADGEVCGPLAATAARGGVKHAENKVTHAWELLTTDDFIGRLDIAGKTYRVNIEYFQVICLAIMFTGFGLLGVVAYSLKHRIPASFKTKIKNQLKKLDKFATDHMAFGGGEDEEEQLPEGSVFGGFLTFSAILVAVLICGLYIYTYFYFNVDVFNSFVPSDQDFYGPIECGLTVKLQFHGYSGCVGDALQSGGSPVVEVSQINGETSYNCNQGSLEVNFNTSQPQTLTQGPSFMVELNPDCPSCVENTTTGVKSCEDCLVTSVSYIEWEISGLAIFEGDDNSVSGQTAPYKTDEVLRGSDSTSVEITLIPTYYKNDIDSIENTGYRVQFSDYDLGDSTSFLLNTTHASRDNETSLIDSEFVGEDVENKVEFKLQLPLFSLRLDIWVTNRVSWLDNYGIIGGLIALIFALALSVMHKFESLWYNPDHPSRKALRRAQTALGSAKFASFRFKASGNKRSSSTQLEKEWEESKNEGDRTNSASIDSVAPSAGVGPKDTLTAVPEPGGGNGKEEVEVTRPSVEAPNNVEVDPTMLSDWLDDEPDDSKTVAPTNQTARQGSAEFINWLEQTQGKTRGSSEEGGNGI
uniref:Tyrosine-protein kinase ephrin type A/B receptor-like domain-containing protein n=1 Tax=Heterosigma akashiwo TaxID=2829 RepID=A0A7S4DDG7_HETAK